MRRRNFLALLSSAALAPWAHAQGKSLHVGIVAFTPRSAPHWGGFEQRLRELGHDEGRNLQITFASVRDSDALPAAIQELLGKSIDILIATGNEFTTKAALAATRDLPIVMIAIDYDPFALGYVASLARPGGNLTGLYYQQIDLTLKRLELMKDAVPHLPKLTVFWDASSEGQWRAAQRAASSLGLELAGVELREQPYDYERALASAPADHRGALVATMSPIFFNDRARIAEFTLRNRLPAMFGLREFPALGALISYGPSNPALFRRAAEYVDRIAKGTRPADLPIEQPTKFELVVNLKSAKALGLTVPPSLLLRADEVIE